jgi:hypothetical protein
MYNAEQGRTRAGKVNGSTAGCASWRTRLLTTTSLASAVAGAALFGPTAMTPANAACAISVTGNSSAVTNSAAINCISINNAVVNGNVTNAASGKISNTTATGLSIVNSTITGAIINNGAITTPDSTGIGIYTNTAVQGGLSNSGAIVAKFSGINITNNLTFGGGITNSGTISSSSGSGIQLFKVSTFSGGITNSGSIIAAKSGIFLNDIQTFGGGITNSGTISAVRAGIVAFDVSTFRGGITNSGKIASVSRSAIQVFNVETFLGGITNSGVLSAGGMFAAGIDVGGVTSFGGGIINSGMIIGQGGIGIGGGTTISGGISNSGKILAAFTSIFIETNLFQGNLVNSGLLSGSQANGINIDSTSFAGSVINTGTISGFTTGIEVSGVVKVFGTNTAGGGIVNSGAIMGGGDGIFVGQVSTFLGGITNSGSISGGDGAIFLEFVSTFSGGISNLSGGTLSGITDGLFFKGVTSFVGGITNAGTISAVTGIGVASSGAISIFDSGAIIGTGGTAIDLSQNAAGNTLTLGPGYKITGNVLGQGADTFQLGGTGSGSFDLSTIGATQQYRGFTAFNVVSGTWTVSNTFGQSQAWNVNGGTLAGTGTLNSVNVNADGALEPGTIGVPGTFMTINGNLAFQSGAMYVVNIGPNSASRANVSGAVTLNGAVLGVLAPGSYSNKTTYDILDPSSISGTFTGFSAPGFTGTLTYTPTDVLLRLTASLGAGMGLNQNQQNAANAVNSAFNNGATLPANFLPVFGLSGPRLGTALSQIDGEDATGAERGAFDLMNEFLGLMLDPSLYGRDGGSMTAAGPGALGFAPEQQAGLPPDAALAYADALKAPPNFAQRWTAWGAGFGGSATANGDPSVGSNNVTTSTYGYAAGMDYHYSPGTVLGFALAGGGTNWNLAQGLGTGRSDAFQAGLYGVTHEGPAYLAAAFAFANNWFTTNRTAFAGDQLTANFQGQSYGARLEGGYRFAVPYSQGLAGVTPYAAIQAQDFQTPSFSETDLTGGGFGLAFNAMNGTDTRGELGGRFDDLIALGTMPLMLRAKVAWAHDWASNPALNASFQSMPGTAFTVNGAPIPQDSALTSAGAEFFFTPNWSLLAKFDGEFASSAQTYAGSGTLRYTW